MNFDLPIVLAVAVAGLVAGVIIGYALRSYISHRRRRQSTRVTMTHYPLSPPSKIESPSLAPRLGDEESLRLGGAATRKPSLSRFYRCGRGTSRPAHGLRRPSRLGAPKEAFPGLRPSGIPDGRASPPGLAISYLEKTASPSLANSTFGTCCPVAALIRECTPRSSGDTNDATHVFGDCIVDVPCSSARVSAAE